MGSPLVMYLKSLKCINENDFGPGSDEPYVLVWVGVQPKISVSIIPPRIEAALVRGKAFLYGPWNGVDDDETFFTYQTSPDMPAWFRTYVEMLPTFAQRFWGINGEPETIDHADDNYILVAVMEKDDTAPELYKAALDAALLPLFTEQLINSLSTSNPLNHSRIANDLISDMIGILNPTEIDVGIGSTNDLIEVKELRLTARDLALVESRTITKSLSFRGEGAYDLEFTLRKES